MTTTSTAIYQKALDIHISADNLHHAYNLVARHKDVARVRDILGKVTQVLIGDVNQFDLAFRISRLAEELDPAYLIKMAPNYDALLELARRQPGL